MGDRAVKQAKPNKRQSAIATKKALRLPADYLPRMTLPVLNSALEVRFSSHPCSKTGMADPAHFEVTCYQRKPGLWRASFTPKGMTVSGVTVQSVVTDEDYETEQAAGKAAARAIKRIGTDYTGWLM